MAPLTGIRIALVFPYSLSHYTRLLEEIEVLQRAGATLRLVTSAAAVDDSPPDLPATIAPLGLDEEYAIARFARPAGGLTEWLKAPLRWLVHARAARGNAARRRRTLREVAREVDLMWVIDEPLLPDVVRAARGSRARVLYETVDLVPEYGYLGDRLRHRRLAEEKRLVSRVDGFVTACDSYADYYMERYTSHGLGRRPVVRDNMPAEIVDTVRPTSQPLRLLFLGSLMFDRPVAELIEAMALVTSDVTLTLQGKNYLGEAPMQLVQARGLDARVTILEPCQPDAVVKSAHAFDVGIVALRGKNENERRASTSKLFTYMASGLAVLGSDLPGIARVVREYRNGVLVSGMEPRVWASAIDGLAALPPAEIDAMKRASRDAALLHSWENQAPAFVAEFARAVGR